MPVFIFLQIFTSLSAKECCIDIVGEDNKSIINHKIAAPSSASSPNKTPTSPPALNSTTNNITANIRTNNPPYPIYCVSAAGYPAGSHIPVTASGPYGVVGHIDNQ